MATQRALKDTHVERRLYQSRMTVAMLGLFLLVGVLLYRYAVLQIVNYDVYRTQSDRNRIQLQSIAPKRGLIYDRHGELLAENIASYNLTIVKERVDNLDETIRLLAELIPISASDLKKFKRRLYNRRPYEAVPLRFRLSEVETALVSANRHRMPGVQIEAELVRHYKHGALFAHALGYVGRINEREQARIDTINYSGTYHIGKIGLEKYYEDILHGTVGYQNVETNARGRILRVLEHHDPVAGQDLQLNLDVELQRVALSALKDDKGAVVAIDTKTGGVLALVSKPSYDTNLFVNGISSADYNRLRESENLPLFNRAIQGQYPPGSTLKPIFALAGLQYDIVTKDTAIYDPGWYTLPNEERRFRDWKRGGHGRKVDLHQSIVESCDVYYYDLAYKLGIDRLHKFARPFGLGVRTGIDSVNERKGLLPSREWKRDTKGVHWYPGETLNAGIGQGYMLATPLQLAVTAAAFANRGFMFEPRFVAAIGGKPLKSPLRPAVVAKDEAWDEVHRALVDVVHSSRGTAKKISEGIQYKIAGKTGTAQVVAIAANERYKKEELDKSQWDHALFIGYAPAEAPEIAVAVIVENGGSGSGVAAPVAREVFDEWVLRNPKYSKGMADTPIASVAPIANPRISPAAVTELIDNAHIGHDHLAPAAQAADENNTGPSLDAFEAYLEQR